MSRLELRTEIEIAAPVADVYRVLTDFPRYPEWNPFITSISGRLEAGADLNVELSLPEGSDHRFKPKLLRIEPERELRWRGRLVSPLLFEGEHFFQLHALSVSVTRFVHGEDFSGVLLRFMNPTLTLTARGFVYMNEALKKRVENSAIFGASPPAV
jgi:hypothetical protein